jgi:hypothetical protein
MEDALVISITMPVLNEGLLIAQMLAATQQTVGDAKQITVVLGQVNASGSSAGAMLEAMYALPITSIDHGDNK